MNNIFVGAPVKVVTGAYVGYTGRVLECDDKCVSIMEDCHMPANNHNNALNCEWKDISSNPYKNAVRVERNCVVSIDWPKAPAFPTFAALYQRLCGAVAAVAAKRKKMPVLNNDDLEVVLALQSLSSFISGWGVPPRSPILIKVFWRQYTCLYSAHKKKGSFASIC